MPFVGFFFFDLKPANLLLTDDLRLKVGFFFFDLKQANLLLTDDLRLKVGFSLGLTGFSLGLNNSR